MKRFYFILSYAICYSLSIESHGNFSVIPPALTRKECLSLREKRIVPNKEVMFCLARAMASSVLKAFYPVKNKCDEKLNIASNGKTCYSVRAWNIGLNPDVKEHKYAQSLSTSLYYSLNEKRDLEKEDKIKSIELTLEKPLNCYTVYKPIRRLSHGHGPGSSYTISNINMDSTTHGGGVSLSAGYKTPELVNIFVGGFESEVSGEYSGSRTKGSGKGTTMTFKVPNNATCQPELYQTALVCRREAGKLKIFFKDDETEEIHLKAYGGNKGFIMPQDESLSKFYNPLLACVGRK